MTDAEVEMYAMRQAQFASRTMRIAEQRRQRRMTEEEVAQYAQAIRDSILYFNRRDPEHAVAMRYRLEMNDREARQQDRIAEVKQRQKTDVIIL